MWLQSGGVMITVGIRRAKNRLDEYLRKVRAGERVVITERGKPIAEITKPRGAADKRLEAMIREGLAKKPAKLKGASVSDAVIEDRR
jgi:prevent-host-death family protein